LTPALQIREASTGDLSSLLALYAHLNPNDLPCPMDTGFQIRSDK